ncbi:MAG: helix-turn-helix domain-containing protein [Armatimonas sp.]
MDSVFRRTVGNERSAAIAGRYPGAYLRQFREERGISIDDLASSVNTTFRTLQKIETGKTLQPGRHIILALLDFLSNIKKLSPADRARILEPLGYRDRFSLPEADEIEQIIQEWERSSFDLPHPTCLVDRAYRIHAWNRYAPKMLGLEYGHPIMEYFRGKTLLDVFLDRNISSQFVIPNKETFVYEMLEVMRSEFASFREEEWCRQCIKDAKAKYADFRKHWEEMENKPVRQLSLHQLGPISILLNEDSLFRFHLLGTDFLCDSRFRVIQYLPSDVNTMRFCVNWIDSAN